MCATIGPSAAGYRRRLFIMPRATADHDHAHHDGEARRRRPAGLAADVFARIAGLPQGQLHELLPWECKQRGVEPAKAA